MARRYLRKNACGLCGHTEHGHNHPHIDQDGVPLCHTDTHSCYVGWRNHQRDLERDVALKDFIQYSHTNDGITT